MRIKEIDTTAMMIALRKNGLSELKNFCHLMDYFRKQDLEKFERDAVEQCVADFRRYGKGMNAMPYGYFHPCDMLCATTDNMRRGRLSKIVTGAEYTYDFDANHEPMMIQWKPCMRTTLVFNQGNGSIMYLTYTPIGNNLQDNPWEITDIAVKQLNEYGLSEGAITLSWYTSMDAVTNIHIELFDPMVKQKRKCRAWYIVSNATERTISSAEHLEQLASFLCSESDFEFTYDSKMKVIDYDGRVYYRQYYFDI